MDARALVCSTRPRIIELVVCAESADAAHGRAALFEGEKSAVRGAARIPAIVGAPRIGIVWQVVRAHRPREKQARKNNRAENGEPHLQISVCVLMCEENTAPAVLVRAARSVLLHPELIHAGESIRILRLNLSPAIKISQR